MQILRIFIHKVIIQYLSTADIDTLNRPLVPCALQQCDVLSMVTPARKAFINYNGCRTNAAAEA